jgi:hypothetical protein
VSWLVVYLLFISLLLVLLQVVSGVMACKMYVWERAFIELIRATRAAEVASMSRVNMMRAANATVFFVSHALVSFVAFTIYQAQVGLLTLRYNNLAPAGGSSHLSTNSAAPSLKAFRLGTGPPGSMLAHSNSRRRLVRRRGEGGLQIRTYVPPRDQNMRKHARFVI